MNEESSFIYFKRSEFVCSETGDNEIKDEFIHKLDKLRGACGFPFVILSGYRSPKHSIEAAKSKPGQHTKGHAADIKISGGHQRYRFVENAVKLGFAGIGVAKTFVHVDLRDTSMMWSY